MALEGSLTDFGLADILQLIYFQRKTGVLKLEGKMDKVSLLFIEGNIGGAESKRRNEDNRMGKILLKKRHLTEENLEAAIQEQHKTGARLGNILLKRDLVDKDVLKDVLQSQITEMIIQLFGWNQGTYEFVAQGVAQDKDFPFSLDTQHLLMEGLRIVDEWSVIQGKITLDSLFGRRIDSPEGLAEQEREVFNYVDGENDVSTIIDLSGLDNFEVSKTLLTLLEKGFIKTVETAPVITEEPAAAAEKKLPLNIIAYLPYLAVIIALLCSLAGLLINKSSDLKNLSESGKIDKLRMKIETFQLEHFTYPLTLDQITQSKDAWGHPYIYRPTDGSFYIASAGADGVEGTKDDIY